jgi:hypothetical protein
MLPTLEVRPSTIPHGGLGVFAVNEIKKGMWLTEYGGEIIDVEEARQRRDLGYAISCIKPRTRAHAGMHASMHAVTAIPPFITALQH